MLSLFVTKEMAALCWFSIQHRQQQTKIGMMYRIVHDLNDVTVPEILHSTARNFDIKKNNL
jgi:hypothetical protein